MKSVHVIDSHTGGEPTRVVLSGGPDLGKLPLSECISHLRAEHDGWRSAIVCEPRGSDVMVGAYLLPARSPDCTAAVIFFNNVGYLGMCGHGTIGLIVTLAHLGRLQPGLHRIETPVGIVSTELHADGSVSVHNIPARRTERALRIEVEGHGTISGDVAWGGNWFFLCGDHGQTLTIDRVEELTDFTWRIRQALERAGICGDDGAMIDHVELFAQSPQPDVDSRNFVLCPGKAYDRSPCGTGTSAKLACLAAEGELAEGAIWRQESITGSVFEGSYQRGGHGGELILPTIRGTAYVTADAHLLIDDLDPLAWGIRP